MGHELLVGSVIFILTYIAIAFEKQLKVDKTVAALAGGALMVFFILTHHPAPAAMEGLSMWNRHADFDVIFLLCGMMVIVNILRDSGIFQYVAIKCAKLGRGYPLPVLALLLVATATLSAFLDNVTTVLLMAPVTLLVATEMKVSPVTFLIPEILASNLGGTSTLIGDPPNILVGSEGTKVFAWTAKAAGHAAGQAADGAAAAAARVVSFDFVAFLRVLSPLVIVVMAIFIAVLWLILHKGMKTTAEERARIMELDENAAITNPALMKKGLVVMGLTLGGFLTHGLTHLEPGVVAIAGATLLLLVTRENVEEALAKVEWNTLFFFIGLFLVVKGASTAGLLDVLGKRLAECIGRPEAIAYIAPVIILWVSGLLAGVMNNVSFTLAALPIIHSLSYAFFGGTPGDPVPVQAEPMYWALAMGACFGGNLTPVGAAANLVVIGIASRNGHNIGWGEYLKWGLPCAIGSLLLATAYLCGYVWLTQGAAH